MTSQLNRAANSIALNIAEGAGKSSDRAFDYYLDMAVGSIFEVVSGSFLALDRGYITEQEQRRLYDDGEQLGKSVNAFRKTLRP